MGEQLKLQNGQRLVRFLGANSALVDMGNRNTVVTSMVPLAVGDANDGYEPADLDLVADGPTFVARRPLVPVRVAEQAGSRAAVGNGGIHVVPLVGARDAAPALSDGRIFWAGAMTDTDVVAMPVPAGLEVAYMLRSPAAPEELTMELSLPEGASAQRTFDGAGGVRIVRGGRTLARISRPVAVDASGENVNVAFASTDGELVMRVDHRGADVEYPVAVDPAIELEQEWQTTHQSKVGWWTNNINGWWNYASWDVGSGDGLNTWHDAGYFWPWWRGDWARTTPGNSFVDALSVRSIQWWLSQSCIWIGISRYAGGGYPWLANYEDCRGEPWTVNNGYYYGVGPMYPSERVEDKNYVALVHHTGTYPEGHRGFHLTHWGNVEVWYSDWTSPSAPSASGFPGSWVNPNTTGTSWTLSATDAGVGVKRLEVNGDWSTGVEFSNTHPCNGNFDNLCNTTRIDSGPDYKPDGRHSMTTDFKSVPEGDWSVSARSIDLVGRMNPAGGSFRAIGRAKVDRTRPTLALGANSQVGREILGDGEYELTVEAKDPRPGGVRNSGVREVRIYVDGVHRHTATQGLENTDLPVLWYWDTVVPGLGEGEHTVRVEATDGARNDATPLVFRVYVDFTRARFETPDSTGEAEDGAFGEGGWPDCTTDPETGNAYCGEHDDDDPQSAAMQNELALRMFSPLALEATMPELLARSQAQTAEAAQSASGRYVGFGLSDQSDPTVLNPWRDTRFRDLRIPHARIVVPWNLVTRAVAASQLESVPAAQRGDPVNCGKPACNDLRWVERWLREVRRGPTNPDGSRTYPDGLEVLMSIGLRIKHPSRGNPTDPARDPGVDEFGDAARQIIRRFARLRRDQPGTYPVVKRFTAWNEPNLRNPSGAPIISAKRAAQYLRELARRCGDPGMRPTEDDIACRVVGGDFTDSTDLLPSAGPDGRRGTADDEPGYFRRYKDALNGYRPRQWAIHGYGCATQNNPAVLRQLARGTRNTAGVDSPSDPKLWITEAGGPVHWYRTFGQTPAQAEASSAQAVRNLLGTCLNASDRYTRLYLYSWGGAYSVDENADGQIAGREWRWDSGLTRVRDDLNPSDPAYRYRRREAYCVVYENRNPNMTCPPTE